MPNMTPPTDPSNVSVPRELLESLIFDAKFLEETWREKGASPTHEAMLTLQADIRLGDEILKQAAPAPSDPGLAETPKIRCPHCQSIVLWSEDRGAHCDGCDDFDPETDLPPTTFPPTQQPEQYNH